MTTFVWGVALGAWLTYAITHLAFHVGRRRVKPAPAPTPPCPATPDGWRTNTPDKTRSVTVDGMRFISVDDLVDACGRFEAKYEALHLPNEARAVRTVAESIGVWALNADLNRMGES